MALINCTWNEFYYIKKKKISVFKSCFRVFIRSKHSKWWIVPSKEWGWMTLRANRMSSDIIVKPDTFNCSNEVGKCNFVGLHSLGKTKIPLFGQFQRAGFMFCSVSVIFTQSLVILIAVVMTKAFPRCILQAVMFSKLYATLGKTISLYLWMENKSRKAVMNWSIYMQRPSDFLQWSRWFSATVTKGRSATKTAHCVQCTVYMDRKVPPQLNQMN